MNCKCTHYDLLPMVLQSETMFDNVRDNKIGIII